MTSEGAPHAGRPDPNEQAKWEAILANEGMPKEPEREPFIVDQEQSLAFTAAVRDACLYFLDTPKSTPDSWGAHRHEHQELLRNMHAEGASAAELETFSEDYLRDIQTAMDTLQTDANKAVVVAVGANPMRAGRFDALENIVARELAKTNHWPDEVIRKASHLAAEAESRGLLH